MNPSSPLQTIAAILTTMALLAWIESAIPLHPRDGSYRAHFRPNLGLTFLTFATNVVFNSVLVTALATLDARGFGLLPWLVLPAPVATVVALGALDFAFYVAHAAMHASPVLWRFHRVHHADPAIDVTSTIRQHPGEGLIRYVAMAVVAIPLGVTPAAFAIYRLWSALHGLLNHANLDIPPRLDAALALLFGTPNMHKVHHSRLRHEANTNYGTIFSVFDRLCGTFTATARGREVVYGLAGFDDAATQSTLGLLTLPFLPDRTDDRPALGARA